MLRVLYFHEFGRLGGAELALLRLIDALRLMDVGPIALWPGQDRISERLSSTGTHVLPLKVPRWRHGLSLPLLPWFLVRLRRGLPKGSVDLLHVNNYRSAPFGYLVARWVGVPCVCTVREQVSPQRVRQYRLRQMDGLLAVCDAVAQNLIRAGMSRGRVTTILSGVPVPTGLPENSRRAVRDNLGLAQNERIIGIVAHILPHKGYDDLVHALSLVVERCPTVRCLVVGDAPRKKYLGHLLNLADRLGVRGRLVFVGEQEDVAPFVDAMDVFVLPSLTEGLPLTILEAMAVGKPVVGTDVGGISEAVRHGETGFVVPPRDPRKLAEALIGLLGDPSSARAMGEAGRRRVEKVFTMDNEATQTVRAYRRIVSCARPGAD